MNKKYSILYVLSILIFISGCTEWDDFKKYQIGGEIIYPGRGDTVIAYSGKDRAELAWVLSSDPRLTKYKLYWNNRADSLEAPIPSDVIGDTLFIPVNPLIEGTYNFEILSFDHKGNTSVPMRFIARTYGTNYELSLLNRTISIANYDSASKVLTVNWNEPDSVNVTTELNYTGTDLKPNTIQIGSKVASSSIKNWKPGTTIRYQSAFKPNSHAIDIFKVTTFDTIAVAGNY